MLDGLGTLIYGLLVICCIAVPLGIWKLVDIVTWLCQHVSVH
jgi:hypothetical protein